MATARTRKPFPSRSFAILDASGVGCVRRATAANAPLTARKSPRPDQLRSPPTSWLKDRTGRT